MFTLWRQCNYDTVHDVDDNSPKSDRAFTKQRYLFAETIITVGPFDISKKAKCLIVKLYLTYVIHNLKMAFVHFYLPRV